MESVTSTWLCAFKSDASDLYEHNCSSVPQRVNVQLVQMNPIRTRVSSIRGLYLILKPDTTMSEEGKNKTNKYVTLK